MALETGNYLADLNTSNPTAADPKSQGDDHLRLIKTVAKQSFPGFTGAIVVTGAVGGTADLITITPTTALPSYVAPMLLVFEPTAANTGAVTVNVSALGAKSLKTDAGAALSAGDLVNGEPVVAVYDGADFRLLHPTKRYIDTVLNPTVQAYVDNTAFSTALPGQAGNNGAFLATNGTTASWTYDMTGLGASANSVRGGTNTSSAVTPGALASSAAFVGLTDAATVAWDVSTGYNAKVTLGGNRTIGAPTNLQDGVTYTLNLVQDATGSRTVTWNAIWDFGALGTPTLQTGAGKTDKVTAQYNASRTKLEASFWRGA